eukprot:jgi/Orpsp1_1/1179346/evm.model.c7180000068960.1
MKYLTELIKEILPHLSSRLVIKFSYSKEVLLRMLRRNLLIKCLVLLKLLRKLVHLLINLNSQVVCVVILFFMYHYLNLIMKMNLKIEIKEKRRILI